MVARSFGAIRSGEVGQGPAESTLRTMALAAARREGGGSNYASDARTGAPVSGTAAQADARRRLANAGIGATQVALAGGLDPFLVGQFGSNYHTRATQGGRGTDGSGGSGVGTPPQGLARTTLGMSPVDQTVADIIGFAAPFPVGSLVSLFSRLLGEIPGVIGQESIAPRPGTDAFRRTTFAGQAARNLRSQGLGGGFPGPSGIP